MTGNELSAAFDNHADTVFRFAYRMTNSSAIAEDVTQEVFAALVRGTANFDPARGPLQAFLLGVARNQVQKRFRRDGRLELADGSEPAAEPAQRPNQETSTAVAQAVGALSPLQREALVLAEYEGLSLKEIAATVGADIGTVKARLHRARENLRRALAPLRPHQGVAQR